MVDSSFIIKPTFRDYQYPFARPFIGGISANIGFCKRYLVPSRDIGMCLLDPLLADFSPVKGFCEVYADKKTAAWTRKFVYEFPRSEGVLLTMQFI